MDQLSRLAELIDAERARALGSELTGRPLAVLLGTAFPPLTPQHGWQLDALDRLAERGWRAERRRAEVVRALDPAGSEASGDTAMAAVRRQVWAEKARIALRELLPVELGGAELDSTARELSLVADAALDRVLREAMREVEARLGPPLRADGERSTLAVFGMGKLGGLELNAGSDVDLLFVYDTDEGAGEPSLHEHWTAVVRRLVELVEAPSPDGAIWRVDLRLRPEGSTGAIVNSADATERYYTRWGRLWERAALLRARTAAGDARLGLLLEREIVQPFVYRRQVDPGIAGGLAGLVERSRAELSANPARDLKLGPGGIREAEFFVQTLQLVWGGIEPSLRTRGTLAALSRLQSRGLVSDDEATSIAGAYVLLRKLEHRVQWMTGVQTHLMPQGDDLTRLSASMRVDEGSLLGALSRAREVVHRLFGSLSPGPATRSSSLAPLASLLSGDAAALDGAAQAAFGGEDIGEHLRALARRPDGLLGELTRDRYPGLAAAVLDELRASSDPENAAEGLRSFFGRFLSPEPYVAALAAQRLGLRRLVTAFASSAFIRDAVLARPELADLIVFGNGAISDPAAAVEVEIEAQAQIRNAENDGAGDDREALVAGLRIAKQRVMVEVATADLAGTLGTREATRHLAALADAELDRAVRHALGPDLGLAVLAIGKLGGRELGYGSDLDVLFVYDPLKAPVEDEAPAWFSYKAQTIIRLISEPHVAGPGYELDTRLRPSGSQGMLVTSIDAFARYHSVPPPGQTGKSPGVGSSGASWERQALLRARFCAGDQELGARALRVAEQAAYGGKPPDALEIHHLRTRMERELAREREDRLDLKAGRGGLLDVEFAVQFLQMRHGADTRVRTPDTAEALESLAALGYVRAADYEALREGYRFLRRLEQRIHVQRGRGSSTVDVRSPGLRALAHRMGYRDGPGLRAGDALLARYRDVTENVRAAYRRVLGVPDA